MRGDLTGVANDKHEPGCPCEFHGHELVPPLDVVLKNVGPSGSVSWVDDTGWHSRAVSSFPGAEILGGGGNNAVFGMVTQMLPALAPLTEHMQPRAMQGPMGMQRP